MKEKTSNEIEASPVGIAELEQRLMLLENVVFASKDVLTLEEASLFLGLSRSALYKMTHNNVIPFFRPNGKMIYFEKAELLNWIRAHRVASEAEIAEKAKQVMQRMATTK